MSGIIRWTVPGRGTDHAASLEPDGIRRLVRNLNAVHDALSFKAEEILPIETVQRQKLKYRRKEMDKIV